MATQDEMLALHSYILASAEALAAAEKRLLTALGQATTLAEHERGESARTLLTEQVAVVRGATAELSAWLDGPPPDVAR